MNGPRVLGQILLWLGFLSAALAACSQKEYDFLPDVEKASLKKLADGATISQAELELQTNKKIEEMSSEEFEALCSAVAPILQQRAQEAERMKRLTKKPVSELSAAELDEYVSFVIPSLKQKAVARAEVEAAKQAGTYTEPTGKDKKVAKSFGNKEFTAKRTTLIANKWPTVNWLWYGLSMVCGIVGVVLLRKTSKTSATKSTRVMEEYSILTGSLAELKQRIGELKTSFDKLAPHDVVEFIDETCSEPFSDFADARNALIQRFGLQAFAEIMTQFASGERYLNRAWSAAADGYLHEARDSVNRANAHITRASEILAKYQSESKTLV